MSAYNERDIIEPALQRLIGRGAAIYMLDTWSTDGTYELAKRYVGRGVLAVERFPAEPPEHVDFAAVLCRKEQLAQELEADWFIHHDVDEVRVPPWPGLSLPDGFQVVEALGYNCVDHVVALFSPIDDSYVPGDDFEGHFRHFTYDWSPASHPQLKAWRKCDQRIDLHSSGGHNVQFPGRRVFPQPFLLKHYPFRSSGQASSKVASRNARWSPAERARGWHNQYDHFTAATVVTQDPAGLRLYDEQAVCNYCLQHRSPASGSEDNDPQRPESMTADPELRVLIRLIRDQTATIVNFRNELQTRTTELTRTSLEARELAAQVAQAESVAANLEQLEHSWRNEVAALRSTASWKLTEPLRKLKSLAERLTRPR